MQDYLYELSMPNGRSAAAWSTEMQPLCRNQAISGDYIVKKWQDANCAISNDIYA